MQNQNKPASEPGTPPVADDIPADEAAYDGVETQASALKLQVEKAEAAAQEHRDAWLRAKAEADNVRKRAQSDLVNAHKFALESFTWTSAGRLSKRRVLVTATRLLPTRVAISSCER